MPTGEPHDSSGCFECELYSMGWGPACPLAGVNTGPAAEAYANGICYDCGHAYTECTDANDPYFNCKCSKYDETSTPIPYGGIMDHLQPGTAVDVMIVHLPSNKAIYDKTVIVQ